MDIIQRIVEIAKKYKIIYENPPTKYKDALTPIITNGNVVQVFNELVSNGIIKDILPEFIDCVGLDQNNKHH